MENFKKYVETCVGSLTNLTIDYGDADKQDIFRIFGFLCLISHCADKIDTVKFYKKIQQSGSGFSVWMNYFRLYDLALFYTIDNPYIIIEASKNLIAKFSLN